MYKTLATGLCLIAALLAGVQPAVAQDEAGIAAGKAVYLENCAVCHGETLVPTPPAADLKRLRPEQRPRFNTVVMNGLAPEMPAWKGIVTEPQLDQLWAFIQASRR